MRRLIFLCLTANALALALPGPDEAKLSLVRTSRWVSNWALADLNGDHRIDVVTVQKGRRDGQVYDELEIHFGGVTETSYFTIHDYSRNVSVGIRDLDGDHDADIVIEEAWSRKLLGVWLNDGSGNFHEADKAEFRGNGSEQDASQLDLPAFHCDFPIGISEQRGNYALPETSVAGPQPLFEPIIRARDVMHADGLFVDRRSRAPPEQA